MEDEWEKIEEKPDRKYKVEGYYLLNQRAKIEELEKTLKNEKIALTEVEQKAGSLQAQVDTLGASIKAQGHTIEEQKAQAATLENDKKDLIANLNQLQDENSSLNSKVSDLEAKNAQIQQTISDIQLQSGEKESQGMQLMKENDELMSEVSRLEDIITQLEAEKAELAAGGQGAGELQQALEQKDSEITGLQSQVTQLTAKVEQFEAQPFQAAVPPPTRTETLLDSKPQPARPAFTQEAAPAAPSGGVDYAPKTVQGKPTWTCPNCSATRVVEESDKSKILYVAAGRPIYGKKRRCLKCSHEWAV